MSIPASKLSALVTLGAATSGTFNVYLLSGDGRKSVRREILSEWFGERLPLAKCGINSLRGALFNYFQPIGNCTAAKEKHLIKQIADTIEANSDNLK
jgi:hypothetical protein